jgi:LDH2 family malate/lactate/ureidoglycolate dehydrogenase
MPRLPWSVLVDCGVRILAARGTPEPVARRIAELAVETEAWGIATHGLRGLIYFDDMIGKDIDPAAVPRMVKERGAMALIDGNRAFGQLAMDLARETAMRKAREQGVAMVAVRNSFWLAGLAVHVLPIAEAGLLANLWVQHSTGKDCAPFGGIDPRFSTNPIALAFPVGDGVAVSDFSTGIVSRGRVNEMIRGGRKAEEPMFVDAAGELTDDPVAVKTGGSMLFTGGERAGYKGFALSLWSEALTAAAGGRTNTTDVPPFQNWNLTVIDPEAFGGADGYREEMRGLVARVKSSRRRPGVEAIRLPGERGVKALSDARRNGVPISDETIVRVNELAAKNGVAGISQG